MCYSDKDKIRGAIAVAAIFFVFAHPNVRAQVRSMLGVMGNSERLALAALAGLAAMLLMKYHAKTVGCTCGAAPAKKEEEGGMEMMSYGKESMHCPDGGCGCSA